jgi:hypothetical protein
MSSNLSACQQGLASLTLPTKKKLLIQSSLTSNLQLTSSANSISHQSSVLQFKNKNEFTHNTVNFLSFNAFNKGQQMLGDLLRLMCDLKVHFIAAQDSGKLFQTKEGKAIYGNYHIEHYQFGTGKNDTLAFIIDEGIIHQIIKDVKFTTSSTTSNNNTNNYNSTAYSTNNNNNNSDYNNNSSTFVSSDYFNDLNNYNHDQEQLSRPSGSGHTQ